MPFNTLKRTHAHCLYRHTGPVDGTFVRHEEADNDGISVVPLKEAPEMMQYSVLAISSLPTPGIQDGAEEVHFGSKQLCRDVFFVKKYLKFDLFFGNTNVCINDEYSKRHFKTYFVIF